jgi:light-regulated signal transduction histidine kinase (bacteriophytochrome)
MSDTARHDKAVDLSNCDREPIHIPGSIQPHGALLAFDAEGRLAAMSANAAAMLGALPAIGSPLDASHLNEELRAEIRAGLESFDSILGSLRTDLMGQAFDAVLHRSGPHLVLECERSPGGRAGLETFALQAQKAIERIQRQPGIEQVLELSVREIARLSGFDRVMAYRFRHDDSGEVVAEARREDLAPYLGQRYPASDIPTQARRLYALNPLRLIVDANYVPVRLVPEAGPDAAAPLDMSACILRSVSPIHTEYLRNMGVAASMSISIVVRGRLWGLFACHHMKPFQVPYPVRMSCQVLSQIVSMLVDRELTAGHAAALQRSEALRAQILQRAEASEDIVQALAEDTGLFMQLVESNGVAASFEGAMHIGGCGPSREALGELISWLAHDDHPEIFASSSLQHDVPHLAQRFGGICGVLALRIDREQNGYLFWFRNEQIEQVRWGGPPHKGITVGPLGPRLTPRGSFEEWKETVRGQSLPWSEADIDIARILRGGLQEVAMTQATSLRKTREMLLATLGHDLRDPLQAIMMAAQMLGADDGADIGNRLSHRIRSSSGRMQRLIDQMADLSRLQGGIGLAMQLREVELEPLVQEVVDEMKLSQRGVELVVKTEGLGVARLDPDRIAQVLSNLVGNSCKHGVPGAPVLLDARQDEQGVSITIANRGAPLTQESMDRLFQPFKPASVHNSRNRGGQGLGLYIVHEIVKAHGGSIAVRCGGGTVEFEVRLPQR